MCSGGSEIERVCEGEGTDLRRILVTVVYLVIEIRSVDEQRYELVELA